MKRIILQACALFALVLAGGCTTNKAFISAAQSYRDATAPELQKCWDKDPTLSDADKAKRASAVADFDKALKQAEGK